MFNKIASVVGILALMAASSVLTWYVIKTRPVATNSNNGQAEADVVTAKVSKLMVLPNDEKPTVAAVTDATKISSQPFFALAQNGDDILIYQKAQKIILYRPSTNIIINVGIINYTQQESATPSATPKTK